MKKIFFFCSTLICVDYSDKLLIFLFLSSWKCAIQVGVSSGIQLLKVYSILRRYSIKNIEKQCYVTLNKFFNKDLFFLFFFFFAAGWSIHFVGTLEVQEVQFSTGQWLQNNDYACIIDVVLPVLSRIKALSNVLFVKEETVFKFSIFHWRVSLR